MSVVEEILKELNTPEGTEKLKKWAESYTEKENAKKIKIQELLSNTDYIKWLETFTIEHPSFSDDNWLYCPEKISKKELENVNKLHLIYSGIEKYASENYIYPTACDFGIYYKIKLDNTGFEIGRLIGQGTLFFCNRVEIKNEKDFIDIIDIINNKKSNNVDTIQNKLNDLSNLIVSLYKNGIPIEAITSTLNNILNEIANQNNLNQEKMLKLK